MVESLGDLGKWSAGLVCCPDPAKRCRAFGMESPLLYRARFAFISAVANSLPQQPSPHDPLLQQPQLHWLPQFSPTRKMVSSMLG
jgi:hypothetical protein